MRSRLTASGSTPGSNEAAFVVVKERSKYGLESTSGSVIKGGPAYIYFLFQTRSSGSS